MQLTLSDYVHEATQRQRGGCTRLLCRALFGNTALSFTDACSLFGRLEGSKTVIQEQVIDDFQTARYIERCTDE